MANHRRKLKLKKEEQARRLRFPQAQKGSYAEIEVLKMRNSKS
ncbi:hypothetical protein [Alkalihalobacillus pseudalcaliphilus]|nr:hypothetical protein [Alkalihalobacillus pseudalcaliphilus]